MEFHISRAVRDGLDVDDTLFSYTGDVVFANVAAARKFAAKLQAVRDAEPATAPADKIVNAGALFAMGLIDELSHALIARYRKEIDPAVLNEAVRWFASQGTPGAVDKLLLTFTEQFPNTAVYRGELTAAQWLLGTTEDLPNREAALEELFLLWLANQNPAFKPFHDLFDDAGLRNATAYTTLTATFPEFFATRPPLSPEAGSLLDVLRAPFTAAPDSLTAQLDYIRTHWSEHLDTDLKRLLLAIDTVREEDIAIWMRFNPAAPDRYRHGAPGFGMDAFRGDEYIGFDDAYEWITRPDGTRERRLRYSYDYQAPLDEYEAFSADQAWMPNVVMMAKSTYVWLEQLSKKYGRHIHRLDGIPDEELRLLADRGMTALWLIGLWERSVASRTIKRLRGQGDAVASAYSLKRYDIAEDLGGNSAYEDLRNRAARFGIRLASDMVPNHMGIDADWVIEHPDWFLSRPESPYPSYSFNGPDLSNDSRVEIKLEDHYYDQTDAAVAFRIRDNGPGTTRFMYHGNDGTTFAWNDTAQIDYSKAYVREQVIQAILHVARLFPIIRFDAAMVLAKRHVQRLWFPLPGAGGSIPSRAEDAMSQEEFDALMPVEFWREVVDRVAVEVPGTLLLAEAFWMLEGYFVRTLGMHRVYNSAFMNMLRDEENAKYRSYLKKTIEFDPDILKRYVNFMSNPDERTAIDQFGSGDKAFGVATLMATLPGLPMFGHGQIEGYTERYGMEYKQAKMEEWPNEALVARHQHEIAPLLKRRHIFAESTNFVLYDFWSEWGGVDENVFAYSNNYNGERSLVLYNNRYESTRGTIHISAASMDKGSGELRQRSLADGLALGWESHHVVAWRDANNGLEYLRRVTDIHERGMTFDLRGYQSAVLLHWRELRSTAEQPWDQLCDALNGAGVYSVDEALTGLRLRPMHEALRQALSPALLEGFAELARVVAAESPLLSDLTTTASADDLVTKPPSPVVPIPPSAGISTARVSGNGSKPVLVAHDPRLLAFLQAADNFADHAENAFAGEMTGKPFRPALAALAESALTLPALERNFSPVWPASTRRFLPSREMSGRFAQVWAPVLAWAVLRSLPWATPHAGNNHPGANRGLLFDRLQMRKTLAEIFSALGLDGEDAWRAAARVRTLLAYYGESASELFRDPAFWDDADVRWLAGVNIADGTSWFNKESANELLAWMQLPALLDLNDDPGSDRAADLAGLEALLAATQVHLANAEYDLGKLLAPPVAPVATRPTPSVAALPETQLGNGSQPQSEAPVAAATAPERPGFSPSPVGSQPASLPDDLLSGDAEAGEIAEVWEVSPGARE